MNGCVARTVVDKADNAIAAHILAEDAEAINLQMLHDGLISLWIFTDGSVLRINDLRIWGYQDMGTARECMAEEAAMMDLSRPDEPDVF